MSTIEEYDAPAVVDGGVGTVKQFKITTDSGVVLSPDTIGDALLKFTEELCRHPTWKSEYLHLPLSARCEQVGSEVRIKILLNSEHDLGIEFGNW